MPEKETVREGDVRSTVLIIMDGIGIGTGGPEDAAAAARTPNLRSLASRGLTSRLEASGLAVGLPEGQMGNSEVGHTNIGAGRVVYQDLSRINRACDGRSFLENPAIGGAIGEARERGGNVHLMGLMSDGGVHSHIRHVKELLRVCREKGVVPVVHSFLDGRDTPPASAASYLRELREEGKNTPFTFGTVMGRYYAMDRDRRWERLQLAYDALVYGKGEQTDDVVSAVEGSYSRGETDEFVRPIVSRGSPGIRHDDLVIFFNFRPDRAREITRALVDPSFLELERPDGAICPRFTCFTQYDATIPNVAVAFPPQSLSMGLGEVMALHGRRQLRVAETEKYAHVTFFLNGGREEPFSGEDRILVPSPKVATYDLQPEMSAPQVADRTVEAIERGVYDLIVVNFANGDMVGHTGDFDATVKAVETVDTCVGRVCGALSKVGGRALITADHGNADKMFDESGPVTAHTTAPVPLITFGVKGKKLLDGSLQDIAPTLLGMMNIPQPPQMEGRDLLVGREE